MPWWQPWSKKIYGKDLDEALEKELKPEMLLSHAAHRLCVSAGVGGVPLR